MEHFYDQTPTPRPLGDCELTQSLSWIHMRELGERHVYMMGLQENRSLQQTSGNTCAVV